MTSPAPALGPILGAIEIGVLISSVLYGVTCVQTYLYASARASENDRSIFKLLVAAIWIFETCHVVCIWWFLYDSSVYHPGEALFLQSAPWSFDVSVIFHGLIAPTVQAFFNYRVYALSKKLWLALPAWILALLRLVITPAIAIIWGVKGIPYFRDHVNYLAYITLITSVIVDVWTAAVLIYLLWQKRRGYKSTIDIINGIILWTMETNAATALCATMTLVFWVSMPENGVWISILIIYARFYSNSLLVSLNSRDRYRQPTNKIHNSIEISRIVEVEMSDPERDSRKDGSVYR